MIALESRANPSYIAQDHREHHRDLDRTGYAAASDEDARQLRDREDEDEIEEELERRDACAPVDEFGHDSIIPEPPAGAERRRPNGGAPTATQRREKVTLTVADVSCSPGTIGVGASAACALS